MVGGIWLARFEIPFCPMAGCAMRLTEAQHSSKQQGVRDTPPAYRAIIVVRTMPLVGKLAWKDLSARPARSALLVASLAVSIAGIGGVRGAVNSVLDALHEGSRASLGGDVSVETGDVIGEEQFEALDGLRKDGCDWTLVTMILTMASSNQSPDPALATVKVVDPDKYPFYGASSLAADLRGDGVIVSENALRRLNVHIGDPIRIAGGTFHITAVGKADPEQTLGILDRGIRCVLSRENYEKSGIALTGNSSRNRILLRLPPGFDLRAAKRRLRSVVPQGRVLDYQDVNRNMGLRVEELNVYVGEMALLALALGSLGIAIAIRQHLEQRLDVFAMMKLVGARNAQLIAIFLTEIALLVAAALPLGAFLGWMLKSALLALVEKIFPLPPLSGGDNGLLLEAGGAAVLAMIPAVAAPVWMLCRLRPAPFLRKEAPNFDRPGRALTWTSGTILFAAFVAIAHRVLGSWSGAMVFSGTLFVSSWLTLLVAKWSLWAIASAKSFSAAMRLGLGNLTRPGNHAALLIATLAAGTMMLVGSLEAGRITMRAVDARLPYDLTNSLLIAGFQESHREQIFSFASGLPGVEKVEWKAQAGVRLASVNGVSLGRVGPWYAAGCSGRGLVIDREVQLRTGAAVGSQLDFFINNRRISTTVAAVAGGEHAYPVEIDCNALDQDNLFHQAVVRARPGRLAEVDGAIRERFPALAVITAREIEQVIVEVSRDTERLAWIVVGFWVAAGLSILMTVVAASRNRRLIETGVLSALGATPNMLARIYTVEFVFLGAIAGVIGTAAACGCGSMLLALIFNRWEFAFGWQTAAGGVLGSALLTTAAGWMPTLPYLRQKPMNVLRGQ
jgi:putative ABC transport system permease protein